MKNTRRQRKTNAKLKDKGRYILYWMQASQRIKDNHALYEAMMLANHYKRPLYVLFVLDETFKDGNRRNFKFLLEGLNDVKAKLKTLGARFIIRRAGLYEGVVPFLKDATAVVMDDAYLKGLRTVKGKITKQADSLGVPVFYVPSNVIIPVDEASSKVEYAARTIRKKLNSAASFWAEALDEDIALEHQDSTSDALPVLDDLDLEDISVSSFLQGGEKKALKQLETFLDSGLKHYQESSFNPACAQAVSYLSAYLHFGHIAPSLVWREVKKRVANDETLSDSADAFLEQLLVRRELAYNFVWFLEGYDRFEKMTVSWAYETMEKHVDDERGYLYTKADYLALKTHDDYFNAAMAQMLKTGYMHNRMRMYWGKKIIEWSKDYKTAYETILDLNNTYFLDGRDPISYASVAWCFGRHDQAWKEREVFGKLRYMNAGGLKRKSDIEDYVKTWLKR